MIANRIIAAVMLLLFIELVGSAIWTHNDFRGVDSYLHLNKNNK